MTANRLLEFLDIASEEEISQVARGAKTSPAYLTHLARRYNGGRKPGVLLAGDDSEFQAAFWREI